MRLFPKKRTGDRRFHSTIQVAPTGGILASEDDFDTILRFVHACRDAGFRILRTSPLHISGGSHGLDGRCVAIDGEVTL